MNRGDDCQPRLDRVAVVAQTVSENRTPNGVTRRERGFSVAC